MMMADTALWKMVAGCALLGRRTLMVAHIDLMSWCKVICGTFCATSSGLARNLCG